VFVHLLYVLPDSSLEVGCEALVYEVVEPVAEIGEVVYLLFYLLFLAPQFRLLVFVGVRDTRL